MNYFIKFMLMVIVLINANIVTGCKGTTEQSPSSPTSTPTQIPTSRFKEHGEKVTVFISVGGKIVGSGVIISYHEKKVYILTARHILDIKPGLIDTGDSKPQPESPYKITTHKGEEFLVSYDNYDQVVTKINNIDLAILEFPTNNDYKDKVVELTNSFSVNQPIYIFGYIPCSSENSDNQKQEQLSDGNIAQNNNPPNRRESDELEGYDIAYNNNTVPGMSGSPVFDHNDYLIAIHALGGKNKFNHNCETLPSQPTQEFGDNWGVSIRKLLEYKSYLPNALKSNLKIKNSEETGQQNNIIFEVIPTPTPNKTKCPFFRKSDIEECNFDR